MPIYYATTSTLVKRIYQQVSGLDMIRQSCNEACVTQVLCIVYTTCTRSACMFLGVAFMTVGHFSMTVQHYHFQEIIMNNGIIIVASENEIKTKFLSIEVRGHLGTY